jgi:hypothetical protein
VEVFTRDTVVVRGFGVQDYLNGYRLKNIMIHGIFLLKMAILFH